MGSGAKPQPPTVFEFVLPIQAFSYGLWDQCMDSDGQQTFNVLLHFKVQCMAIVNQNIFFARKMSLCSKIWRG